MDLTEKLKGKKNKREIKEAIGVFLLDAIFNDTENATSPVNGRRFPALSSDYKKAKKGMGRKPIANLRLFENMLPALKVRNTQKGIKLEITSNKEIPKAYNHNVGDTLPQRQFLPDDGGEAVKPSGGQGPSQFRRSINDAIDNIIESMTSAD